MVTLVAKLNLPTYHRKLLAAGRSKSDRKHQPYFSTNCRCNTRALAVGLPGVPMSRRSNVQASVSPSVPISRRSNVPASGSPSVPISRRSNVPASRSPSVPMSRRSNVPASRSPSVPMSRRSNVQASGSSSVPMSRRCNISACGCPDTCTSQSPHAQAAQHRDFQGSEPPRPQTAQVQTTTTSVSPGPKTPRSPDPPALDCFSPRTQGVPGQGRCETWAGQRYSFHDSQRPESRAPRAQLPGTQRFLRSPKRVCEKSRSSWLESF